MNHGSVLQRISGILLRHFYLLRQSWPRLIEIMYWPTLNMITWGFLNSYLVEHGQQRLPLAIGLLLGATMLWDVMLRGQVGVIMGLLEEIWSRNFTNLFVSPISPSEFVAATLIYSLLRGLLAMLPCFILAIIFFNFSIFSLGLPLIGFMIILLMTGWWGGVLLCAMTIRFGQSVEWLVWMLAFTMTPFVGVYYPLSIMPEWMQVIGRALPPTYVFEGMRQIIQHHSYDPHLFVKALVMNFGYLIIAWQVFLTTFENARNRGNLVNYGE